jgi:hypothetical protein
MAGNRFWVRGVFTLCWLGLAGSSGGQPQLTTIEDIVYRADGQRFSGIAMIQWRSFLAADNSSIAAYSKTVGVIDGVLKTALVPTTTASAGAYYLVRYNSNGRVQFTEYWAVSPSATPLKLKDIRLVGPPLGGQPVIGTTGTIQISDVVGLTEELAARSKKGLGYTPSRSAVINAGGDLEAASGTPTDCMRVNGAAGPCDVLTGPTFVDGETPAGLINGVNSVFTLANSPNPPESLHIYRNGLLLKSGTDYTLSTNTINFLSGAIPQAGDLLTAVYRIAPIAGQSGAQAGGALSGYYPSPSLAPGAITNLHVAAGAGITESKLALNFPTHTSANDPAPDQKSALAGTSGTPSNTNRYVTDQDPRMTNTRTPTTHALLAGAHFDTNAGVVTRGDLIVGQGTSPVLWSRLPLGAANRCLISNGFDAVWNACLFTGFPNGAVPFVDSTGNLAHNGARLNWDNANRRMGVGVPSPSSTLTVYDASVGDGQTQLTVRAGQGQSTAALQRWQNNSGTDLARIEQDGILMAPAIRAASTASTAAWQDAGAAADPSSTANGNAWYNLTEHARKTTDGGQTHTALQAICSIAGTATSSLTPVTLGVCRIPAALLRPGDRFRIHYDLSHEGAATGFSYIVTWGGITLAARSGQAADSMASGSVGAVPLGATLYWNWQNWGTSTSALSGTGFNTSVPAGDLMVEITGQMAAATSETLTLRNLAIERLPAQVNP